MTVHRRHVLFIDGFEPRGPARLHAVCREAAEARGGLDGVRVAVGPRRRLDAWRDAWTLTWEPADHGPATSTRFEVLRWDDVVRAQGLRAGDGVWTRASRLAADLALTWSAYLLSGVAGRMRQRQRGTWVLMWYPSLVAAALAAAGLVLLTVWAWALAQWPDPPSRGDGLLGLAVALVATLACSAWVRRQPRRLLAAAWLCRLLGFTALQARGALPQVDERLNRMADRLAQLSQDRQGADEVLVVGYSTGTILAALALDAARRRVRDDQGLSLLTLGHCLPILSYLGPAQGCRAALERLAADPGVVWLDITAPGDVAAFGDVPPWGDAPVAGLKRMRSPRWHRLLPEDTYAALRADREALHRQYLRGPVRAPAAGEYDFMGLIAGPLALPGQPLIAA